MIEIEFLGRGGQGVVIASEILARACFEEGMYPQGFSIFGGGRRGAPVAAFVRVSDQKIYLKCDIEHPDHLILFDSSRLSEKEVAHQVQPGGVLIFNTKKEYPFDLLKGYRIGFIDALEISKKSGLGEIVNTAILGAYVGLSRIVRLDTLLRIISDTAPAKVDQNVAAAREAYQAFSISKTKGA